jgi:hypothetical protein
MAEILAHGRDPVAERVALNDVAFREANEGIEETARSLNLDGLLPFICECADTSCTSILQLTCAEYEAVRAEPTHFINVPGHERSAQGWARVVETYPRYAVVAKVGDAAAVAAEHDPHGKAGHGRT